MKKIFSSFVLVIIACLSSVVAFKKEGFAIFLHKFIPGMIRYYFNIEKHQDRPLFKDYYGTRYKIIYLFFIVSQNNLLKSNCLFIKRNY